MSDLLRNQHAALMCGRGMSCILMARTREGEITLGGERNVGTRGRRVALGAPLAAFVGDAPMTCVAATPTHLLAGAANGAVHILRLRSYYPRLPCPPGFESSSTGCVGHPAASLSVTSGAVAGSKPPILPLAAITGGGGDFDEAGEHGSAR